MSFGKSILLLILFFAGMVLGCHRSNQAPLQLMVWIQPEEKEALEKQVKEFSRQNGNLKVELLAMDSEAVCRLEFLSRFEKGKAPDVWMISSKDLSFWACGKFLQDLFSYHLDEKAFLPDSISSFVEQGKLYAVPYGWSTLVLYYNSDIFERHGVPLPQASWDWGDLLTAARSLTVMNEENSKPSQYGLEINSSIENWLPFIWQYCGQIVNEEGGWALTDPQFFQSNQQTLEFYADLVRESQVAPPPSQGDSENPYFLKGRAAMTIGSRSLGVKCQKNKIHWDIVSLPQGSRKATLLEVYGYAISSQSKQAANAWKLISFLTRETSQASMIQYGNNAPSWKSLLSSKIFLDFPGPQGARNSIWTESLPIAKTVPYRPDWQQASSIFSDGMNKLMSDPKMSGRVALEEMQLRFDELSIISSSKGAQQMKFIVPKLRTP